MNRSKKEESDKVRRKKIARQLKNFGQDRTSPWGALVAFWGCCAPILSPITIVGNLFLVGILWTLRAAWLTGLTIYRRPIPIIIFLAFGLFFPFHESQRAVLQVLDVVFGCIDSLWNGYVRPLANTTILGFKPYITIHNFIVQFVRSIAKMLDNILRTYLVQGLQPAFCSLISETFPSPACDAAFDQVNDILDLTLPPNFEDLSGNYCNYPFICGEELDDCLDEYLDYLQCAGESVIVNIDVDQFADFEIEEFYDCRGFLEYRKYMVNKLGLPYKTLLEIQEENKKALDFENYPGYIPLSHFEIGKRHGIPEERLHTFDARAFRDLSLFPNAEEYTVAVIDMLIEHIETMFDDLMEVAVWGVAHVIDFAGWIYAKTIRFFDNGASGFINDAAAFILAGYVYLVEEVLELNCISDNFDFEDEDDLDSFVIDVTRASAMGLINCPCQLVEDVDFGIPGRIPDNPAGPPTYVSSNFRGPEHLPCAILTCMGLGCACTDFDINDPKVDINRILNHCLIDTLRDIVNELIDQFDFGDGNPFDRSETNSYEEEYLFTKDRLDSNENNILQRLNNPPSSAELSQIHLHPRLQDLYADNPQMMSKIRSLDPVTLWALNQVTEKLEPEEKQALLNYERNQKLQRVLFGDTDSKKRVSPNTETDNILGRFQQEFIMNPIYGNLKFTKFRLFANLVKERGFRWIDYWAKGVGPAQFDNETKKWNDLHPPDHSLVSPRARARIAKRRGIPIEDVGKKPFSEQGLTNFQVAIRGLLSSVDATTDIFDSFYWDPEIYDFSAPSWREINSVMERKPVVEGVKTFISRSHQSIRDINERAGGKKNWPQMLVQIDSSVKLMMYRFMAPQRLEEKVNELSSISDTYGAAVKRALPDLLEGGSIKTLMEDIFNGRTTIWDTYRYMYILRRSWNSPNITSREIQTGEPLDYIETDYNPMMTNFLKKFGLGWDVEDETSEEITEEMRRDKQLYMRKLAISQRKSLLEHAGKPMPKSSILNRVFGKDPFNDFEKRIGQEDTRLPAVGAFKLLLPFLKNPRAIGAFFSLALTTRPSRVFLLSFFENVVKPTFGDIYKEGLDILLPSQVVDIATRFTLNTAYMTDYLLQEALRATVFCNWWGIFAAIVGNLVGPIVSLIPYVGQVISSAVGILGQVLGYTGLFVSINFSYCPPKPEVDSSNLPVNRIWNYISNLINCVSNQPCSTSNDCISNAPCRCGTGVQYESLFWEIDSDRQAEPCPAMSGRCLCWPELPTCIVLPRTNINDPFTVDCQKDLGWKTEALAYYNNPSIMEFFNAIWSNLITGVKYVSRTIIRGWEPWISENILFFIFATIGVWLALTGKPELLIALLIIGTFVWLATPYIADFVGDILAPGLQDISDYISSNFPSWLTWMAWPFDQLIDFLIFPNASDAEPLGSPQTGELTCFITNTMAWLLSIAIFLILFVFIFQFLLPAGGLTGIRQALQGLIIAIPRCLRGCCLYFIVTIDSKMNGDEEAEQEKRVLEAIDAGIKHESDFSDRNTSIGSNIHQQERLNYESSSSDSYEYDERYQTIRTGKLLKRKTTKEWY